MPDTADLDQQLHKALRVLNNDLPLFFFNKAQADALHLVARKAARLVRTYTPVGPTGNLRRSVRAVRRRGKYARHGRGLVFGIGESNVEAYDGYSLFGYRNRIGAHASWIEEGTGERFHASGKSVGRIEGRHMFQRALDAGRTTFKADYLTALQNQYTKQGRALRRKLGLT